MGQNCLVAKKENPKFATKFLIVVNMTDYEYILNQAKKFYFTKWDDEEFCNTKSIVPMLFVNLYK